MELPCIFVEFVNEWNIFGQVLILVLIYIQEMSHYIIWKLDVNNHYMNIERFHLEDIWYKLLW